MLTGIATYLFGANEEKIEVDAQKENQCSLNVVPVENEWVLVQKDGHDGRRASSPSILSSTADMQSSLPLTTTSSPTHSIPSSEDGWLVTPPPCFTAGPESQHDLTTSSMENLLIEHPSMSVYAPRGRKTKNGMNTDHSSGSSETNSKNNRHAGRAVVQRQPPHRPKAVAARAGIVAQLESIKPMQKLQVRYNTRQVTRNKLEKTNKVIHHESKSKHMRRKHHMIMQPSNVRNNRRC